jgi:uncharacterized protein (DUF1501 family)
MSSSRRQFLKMLAAGAGATALIPPTLVRADSDRPHARAARVLILNLPGGIRSSAAFGASTDVDLNPWGLIPGSHPFPLGRMLDDHLPINIAPGGQPETAPTNDAYRLGPDWNNEIAPRFRDLTHAFSIIGSWNENRGDHALALTEESTGGRGLARPGMLTRINLGLAAELEARGAKLDIPGFHIAPNAAFGQAPGATVTRAPVPLSGPHELPSGSNLDHRLEERLGGPPRPRSGPLDLLGARGLGGRDAQLAATVDAMRIQTRALGERLAEPWLHTGRHDEEALESSFGTVLLPSGPRPLTNAMLHELLALGIRPDAADPWSLQRDATNVALALRLLQFGAPAVVAEIGGWDYHSGELQGGPATYRMFGQLWASLYWLLSLLPEPGQSDPTVRMIDRTLVIAFSDFGRDPGPIKGFNGGDGTDHGVHAATWYLGHPIMGAGVLPGRWFGSVQTNGSRAYDARASDRRITHHDVMATILEAIGLPGRDEGFGFPNARPALDLWGNT